MAIDESEEQMGISITPLTDHIGAEVIGADLASPMDGRVFDRIRRALSDWSVLVLRGQNWTPEEHIEFSRRFGPLEDHVLSDYCLPGHPEIFVVSNIIENGEHIGAFGGSKRYHSDLSYMREPSLGSIFHCLECPEGEGETCFTSMFAVYDALPADRKKWLEARLGIHNYVWNFENYHQDRPPLTDKQKAKTPLVSHPAVRTHPENGRKALYVSDVFVSHFKGENYDESRALVKELIDFASQPQFEYVHRWTPGDVIIWDNRSVLHKALPFDETNARRRMHRTTIRGDQPFLDA
jgi:taurine dioxygenase